MVSTVSTIVSKDDCLARATDRFGGKVTAVQSTLQVDSYDYVPVGCSVKSGGDWAAYYNLATYGWSQALGGLTTPYVDDSYTGIPGGPWGGTSLWSKETCPSVSHTNVQEHNWGWFCVCSRGGVLSWAVVVWCCWCENVVLGTLLAR